VHRLSPATQPLNCALAENIVLLLLEFRQLRLDHGQQARLLGTEPVLLLQAPEQRSDELQSPLRVVAQHCQPCIADSKIELPLDDGGVSVDELLQELLAPFQSLERLIALARLPEHAADPATARCRRRARQAVDG
jgi:hypothetical protein